ncbi:membrane dipeptidase-domain-containing protein [Apiospora saccharicola]|uniref:Dipeptidase n=1 Tax=Apiospora saccharicola TaxID=335842 RepID=A0ABR1TLW7_9PEZI
MEPMYEKLPDKEAESEAPPSTRRPHSRGVVAFFIVLICFGTLLHPVSRAYHPACKAYGHVRPKTIEDRVRKILTKTPLIDGHDDFPLLVRYMYDNHIYSPNFTKPFSATGLPMHVDLPRLRAGLNGGAFWSVYAPCPANGSDFSEANYLPIVQFTLQQIDMMTRLTAAYPDDFSSLPDISSKSALKAFREGKLISPLGVEGLHQIGNSVATLRRFHALGVRYATLTHNCGNIFADAAIREYPEFGKAPPFHGGVSPLGQDLVKEMNRIGMLVDLSHVSEDTMRDVLGGRPEKWAGSIAPVMFSHSSAYALCPHPRNVPDDVLQLVKQTNSIVMVNFAPDFISCIDENNPNGIPTHYPPNATMAQVANHVTYIGNLIGYDHVGLGSDFDGIMSTPEGLPDVSAYPDLIAELLQRGVSDKDAAKVAGGNVLRVWAAAEAVAAQMQKDNVQPMEDDLPRLKFASQGWINGFEA